MKKLTTEEWISRAREAHGDRYDYSLVKYATGKKKVVIICPDHGYFEQQPNNHSQGEGCRKCSYTKLFKRRKEDAESKFFSKSLELYGSFYDYSSVIYISAVTPVKISCPTHGEFLQTPDNHIRGHQCPRCAVEKRAEKLSSTTTAFVSKATRKHNGLYNYDTTVYVNSGDKVKITCKIHGEFLQTPENHLAGNGCPECGRFKNKKHPSPFPSPAAKKFINKANELFLRKFTYNHSTYTNIRHSMEMICPDHSVFLMTPKAHLLSEAGCPQCETPEGFKRCVKCRGVKELDEFYTNKVGKLTYSGRCRECTIEFQLSFAPYAHYGKQLTPCDKPTNVNGKLFVACKKCRKLFQPTRRACSARVDRINKTEGDSNFYCSDDCKNACSLYGARSTLSVWSDSPRKCDKQIKAALIANQCEERGELYCEKCGDTYEVDFHHVLTVKEYGDKATHPAASMLLCPGCHTKLHAQCK